MKQQSRVHVFIAIICKLYRCRIVVVKMSLGCRIDNSFANPPFSREVGGLYKFFVCVFFFFNLDLSIQAVVVV